MINYATQWKKNIKLRAFTFSNFVSAFPTIPPSYFLAKIDGQLSPLVYEEGRESIFQTTSDHIVKDLPVIEEYESLINRLGFKQTILVGELVAKRGDKILPFNIQQSMIKKSYLPGNKPNLYHYLFDVYYVNDKEIKSFSTSYKLLQGIKPLLRKYKHLDLAPMAYGGMKEFRKFFANEIEVPGVEGVVVRTDGKNYKVKIPETFDVVILGAGNIKMKLWPRKQISYLITGFVDKNKNIRLSSKVGTGFNAALRSKLYDYVMDNKILETDDGNIFIPPERVSEVQCNGYFFKEMPIYEYKNKQYIPKGKKLSITLRQPSFIRFRPDKTVNDYDVRLTQAYDFPLNEAQMQKISERIIGYWKEND